MKQLRISVLCSFVLAMIISLSALADGLTDCTNIETEAGKITGVNNKGVCEYKGVPYAAPPVGELRFRLPQPPLPLEETLVADTFGPDCFQTPMVDLSNSGKAIGDEDCLYLNIWSPQKPPLGKKPVMLFIHGGGFQHGSGTMDTYHGARLAATGDVVIITINYRLGPFGFFIHPSLTEPDGTLEGNYGIYDQIASLEWVQKNIEAFGGDPDNVTVFGESAGGMSIGMLLISPLAEGLFHKAVIESGPVFLISRTLEGTLPKGKSMADAMGCDDPATAADCLRDAPADEVLHKLHSTIMFLSDSPNNFPAEPLIGGKLIPDTPYKMYKEGRYLKDVQIMLGSNKDEFSFFTSKADIETQEELEAKIASDKQKIIDIIGVDVFDDELISLYDSKNYESPKKAYTDLMGDVAFTCTTRMLANAAADNGSSVYLYHFTYEPEGVEMLGDWGAFHGSELPFVFGNMTFLGIKFPSKQNKLVSKEMRAMWSSFAHTGTPSYEEAPAWPKYDSENQGYMDLKFDMEAGNGFKKDRCDIFEKKIDSIFE